MRILNRSMLSTTSDQANYQNNYKLWDRLDLSVAVDETYKGLPVEALFSMAIRVNKKRQFLFVSKLIAKHLAVNPVLALGTGTLLASLLMEKSGIAPPPQVDELAQMVGSGASDAGLMRSAMEYRVALPEKTLFIGMAETATGLGHSVFQHFTNSFYIHTTREDIAGLTPSFVFEEEHSHATSHRVYAQEGILEDAEAIVLIDDEISTGNTLVNLIKALDSQFPGKSYTSLSILDWRSPAQQQNVAVLGAERGIGISVLSLASGQFELHHGSSPDDGGLVNLRGQSSAELAEADHAGELPHVSETGQRYLPLTGRFGLSSAEHLGIDGWALRTAELLQSAEGEKPLVIGIGENMYLPLRLAFELSGEALVQTTTRSPIFAADEEGYPIKGKAEFVLPDSAGVAQFIYNLDFLDITKIYLVAESVADPSAWEPLLAYLEQKAPVEWISLTKVKRRGSAG
ncbi:phosphoribosyltransferase family protein [Planococcus sp. FY231025]|uniref:phosphoribosyltransferase family protein n=1 Tax=Planococcus sp. FY231025 TaxID=3455699 RepID=UPI003F915A09